MDQAGRVALGRHAQRHDRSLAQRLRGAGGVAFAVLPRDRRRTHRARRRRPARADVRSRCTADAASRHQHDVLLRRRLGRRTSRPAVLRDVREPRHLPPGLDRGHPAQHTVGDGNPARDRRRRLGALRPRATGPRPATSPTRTRPSSQSCSGCSSSRRPSTTCCRSTTGGSSGSTPTSRDGPNSSRARPNCCSAAWGASARTRC